MTKITEIVEEIKEIKMKMNAFEENQGKISSLTQNKTDLFKKEVRDKLSIEKQI